MWKIEWHGKGIKKFLQVSCSSIRTAIHAKIRAKDAAARPLDSPSVPVALVKVEVYYLQKRLWTRVIAPFHLK